MVLLWPRVERVSIEREGRNKNQTNAEYRMKAGIGIGCAIKWDKAHEF